MYGGIKYFLAMGITDENIVISNKVKILEEIIDGTDTYVSPVTDNELIIILTRILKAQL